jgi:hypothetical protein
MTPSRTLVSLLALTALPALPACDGVDTDPGPDLDIVTLEARAGERRVRAWDFGETGVFLETPALGLTISNESRAPSGRIDVTLHGPDAGHFVATGDCRDVFLVPRATCSLRVRFQPTTAGVRHATVRVAEDDGASVEIALTGTGTGSGSDPMLTVDPPVHDFGLTAVGDDVDDVHSFAVRNASARDITDLTVVAAGAGFAIEPGGCGATLRAYETCMATVRLTPAALGPLSGALEIRGGGRSNAATLSGIGAYRVSIGTWWGDGGSGVLTSNPEAFSCDITCSGPISRPCHGVCEALFTGDSEIIAIADPNSRFAGWETCPQVGSTPERCMIPAGLAPVALAGGWQLLDPPSPPTEPTGDPAP